ncbi:hypothetical protein EVAR_50854_1 [Eumeta japonica]|uniref:Uncharacterized protein n=1 Tax=Eumeta variegata TaxID=151549 RepID=A0A4C1Y4C1_EUMVA|nr:hypothetical protein EVAR_50854_1 [Eumeta japonica]
MNAVSEQSGRSIKPPRVLKRPSGNTDCLITPPPPRSTPTRDSKQTHAVMSSHITQKLVGSSRSTVFAVISVISRSCEVGGRGSIESVLDAQRIKQVGATLGPERIKARARAAFSHSQTAARTVNI